MLRRRDPAGGFAADTSARAAGFLVRAPERVRACAPCTGPLNARHNRAQPGLEALDDLPLELMGDDEEAESQLFSLLQRLRFSGTEAGASFGFDLCELALAVGAAQPGDAEADAAGKEAQADRGDTADKAATEASPEPKRNRAAARQRARFVKSLLAASLAEPEARGADEGPP